MFYKDHISESLHEKYSHDDKRFTVTSYKTTVWILSQRTFFERYQFSYPSFAFSKPSSIEVHLIS